MPSSEDRKKAIRAYKEKETVGGLYRIRNTVTGWQTPLESTPNIVGIQNRLQFAKKTNHCSEKGLDAQWKEYGPDAFEFVEVERLTRKPEQTTQEFYEELGALLELYREKE